MKRLILILSLFSLFIFCNKISLERKDDSNNNITIDSLFSKSIYNKLSKEKKIVFSNKLSLLLQKRENDSLTRFYYFRLAGRYFNLEEYEKYQKESRKVLLLSKKAQDTLSIAKSYQFLGDYYFYQFRNDSAFYYYSKSEKEYLKSKTRHSLVDIQLSKAKILYYVKDFAGCETSTIKVLKTAIAKKNYRLIYECYLTLGNTLDGLNNHEKAIEYYTKAYNLKDNLINDTQYSLIKVQPYNFIGSTFNKNKQYKKAIPYLQKALSFGDFKKTDKLLYADIITNLAYSEIMLGNKKAINLLNESLDIQNNLKNVPGIIFTKIKLAEYYLINNSIEKAAVLAKESRDLSHENNIFEDELKALNLLSRIEPQKSKFYNDRFIALSDSLQTVERATRNKFARIEFETEEIITEKNIVETKNEILAKRILWITGVSLFLIFGFGIAYYLKRQHAKNKELQFEQAQQKANQDIYQLMLDQQTQLDEGRKLEKKRISQELHDGIMSKLTSVRLNLFVLNKKTDPETIAKCLAHVAEIQNIEKEIRAISRDLQKEFADSKDSFKLIIEDLFQNHQNTYGTEYDLSIDDKVLWDKMDSNIKMNIYRIFQESLHNISKYANATKIEANIFKNENSIKVIIADNGKGFNTSKTKEGIGLKNMQSRVDSIGGTFEINSEINLGTSIVLEIPN